MKLFSFPQEQVFDHAFLHLGLGDESSVHHPVLVTEPACNLTSCRAGNADCSSFFFSQVILLIELCL